MIQNIIALIIVGITVLLVIYRIVRPLFQVNGSKSGIHSCGGCGSDCGLKT
jgi:hypothetical protein